MNNAQQFCFQLFQKVYWIQELSVREDIITKIDSSLTNYHVTVSTNNHHNLSTYTPGNPSWFKRNGYKLFNNEKEALEELKLCISREISHLTREAAMLQTRLNSLNKS